MVRENRGPNSSPEPRVPGDLRAPVHVNTLLLQEILAEPGWSGRVTDEDRRALSPLFWAHVNPYGRFVLDMDSHLDLATPPEIPGHPAVPLAVTPDAVPSSPIQ